MTIMAVNVQAELESQLAAINDKLAGLQELQTQKARIEATLALLKGEISLDNFRPSTAKKANVGSTGRTMDRVAQKQDSA
jgi:Holliday junction resolvasome RuvABC endonuclease subunit